jgi:hypothetical protein
MKSFPEMDFNERVAWARGHILVAVGEGRFGDAVWLVCHQFTLWSKPENRKEAKAMATPRRPQGPKVRKPQGPKRGPRKGAKR